MFHNCFIVFPCKQIWENKHTALIFCSQYYKDSRNMDILAIRGQTVSAVICQLQLREYRIKLKIECCDQFSNFVFRNKNWSIDRILSDKSTKRLIRFISQNAISQMLVFVVEWPRHDFGTLWLKKAVIVLSDSLFFLIHTWSLVCAINTKNTTFLKNFDVELLTKAWFGSNRWLIY